MGSRSVLDSANFKRVDVVLENDKKEQELKSNIYQALENYVEFLQETLDNEKDSCERYLIETKIERLRKEQSKYYVPSILETAKFEQSVVTCSGKRLRKLPIGRK